MNITADEIIAKCEAYEPYRPIPPEEQMSHEEMIQQLKELRCIYLGTRRSMALGLALARLEKAETNGNN